MKLPLLALPILTALTLTAITPAHAIRNKEGIGMLPTFKCTLTNKLDPDRWPGVQKDSFGHNDAKIYFICESDNAATGDRIRAVWLADHTVDQGESYETVGVRSMQVVKRRNGGEMTEADLSMEKPSCGWRLGHYEVQVYINDIPGYNYKFVIR